MGERASAAPLVGTGDNTQPHPRPRPTIARIIVFMQLTVLPFSCVILRCACRTHVLTTREELARPPALSRIIRIIGPGRTPLLRRGAPKASSMNKSAIAPLPGVAGWDAEQNCSCQSSGGVFDALRLRNAAMSRNHDGNDTSRVSARSQHSFTQMSHSRAPRMIRPMMPPPTS